MRVPAPIKELNEAHVVLQQTPGEQAVVRKGSSAWFRAVAFKRGGILVGQIHHLGSRNLHPEGQFVLGDPSKRFRITVLLALKGVELCKGFNGCLARIALDPWRV